MSLNGELLPKGAIGELCISGKGLSPGYWNNKKLTNEVFVANPFEEHSMLYKTGDLARWNKEGEIEFFDRVDRQVKFQGTRVELGEIERAIESYAPVNKAYVRKQVDGKGERLVGYYSSTIPLNVEQLKQHLEKWLPRNVIPSSLIGLLSFPLTTQGKINEASLPKAEENPLKNPTNSMEEKLLNLWKDTLKTKDLGITHDFFQHGGHSLNGIQLVNRINYILGSGFTIGDLYENASVEKFAEFAATSNTSSFEIISSIEEQEYYNLSNTQKRFWILQHYHAGRDLYKMPAVIKINGSLDVPRFEAALKSVIIKHQLLRTVFPEVNKVPKQKILKDCEWLHLKVLEVKDWEHFQLKFEYEFLNQPFDFSSCPPINVSLLKINSTQCICYLMMHHIISDGFSMQLLAKDLLDYYFGQEGDHPQIDDQIQYKDYANWKPNLFDQSLHYWDNVLTRGIPNVQLPLDYDRSKTSIGETTVYNAVLQATAFESITTISKQLNITLNSILLGAFGIIACKWAKATEIMIGTVVSNRTHIQLEGLIGPLINFLPIKVQLSPQADIKNDLLAIDSSFRNALKNQEIPFDMLVNKYAGRRSENRNPIFDIAFNFHSHDSMNAVLNPQGHAEPQFIYHDFGNGVSNMDLRLDVVQQENTLGFSLEYNSTLFNPSTIDTLMNAYHNLMNDLSSVLLQTTSGFQPFEKAIPTELTGDPYKNLKLLISSSFIIEPINHAMLDWGEGAGFKLDIEFKYNQIIDDIFNFSTNHEGKDHHGIFFIRFEDWFREWDTNLSHDLLIKKMDLLFIDLTSVLRKQFPLPENTYIVILPHNKGKFEPTVDHHLRRLTEEWITFCRLEANVRLLDFGEIDALYKISDLFNSTTEKLGHMPFTQDFYNCIGTHIIRNLYVRYNPPFKVIAVDCDNTLWQGICGEIGPTKVVISEGCRSLQEFLIQKSKEGFLIVLCSKNNEEDVWQVFEQNSDMRLQKNHITDFKINWMPKSQNLKALAFELNVALDSFIFLDDNPQECEEIERILPEVLALQIPSEHLEIQSFLDHIWAFDQLKTTKEDSNRTAMYKANKVRKEEELKFDSLEDFINSLELQVRLFDLNEQHLDRAFQLLHRTNQFNLNKIELSENELRGILEDDKILSLGIQVEDKYGDYGFVGLLIARPAQTKLLLDSLILSCRVLGKKVEHKILDYLTKYCNEAGLEFIEANFKRTEKNKPIQEFLEKNWGKQATGLYVFQPAMQSTF
jgi:FkbH-like protein